MRRSAVILAASAAALLSPPGAAPASAGTYTTQLCHNLQPNPPGAGGGWSTQVAGSAISSNANPTAWIDTCSHYRNNVGNWGGLGGAFGDTTAPGSYAFAKFIPPAGSTISGVRAWQDIVITSGAYAEAGIFAASTGRALADNSAYLNGDGISQRSSLVYDASFLGTDGPQGLLFGGRCPASLPPLAGGYCGGAGSSYGDLEISIDDPSPPVVDASIGIDSSGRATLTWLASDPQSGIEQMTVARVGGASSAQPTSCNVATAPRCQVTVSGSTTTQLAEGETATYTVTGGSWGGTNPNVSKTVSVTRPQSPAPTTPPTTPTPTTPPSTTPPPTTPPTTAANVSFKTKAVKGGRLKLSGSARGCKRVSVSVPGRKHHSTAAVKRGKWSVTVTRKRGTYRAKCGAVTAKRTVR